MNELNKGTNYITQAGSRLMGLLRPHPEIPDNVDQVRYFEEPEISPIELQALDLLRSAKQAADQETTDRARAIHEEALKQDHTLTLIGQLGAEALGLYNDFDKREQYFMQGVRIGVTKPKLKGIDKYASRLVTAEGYTFDRAKKIATAEYDRRKTEERSNKLAERFAKARGGKLMLRGRVQSGRLYRSPAFNEVDAELLDPNAMVSQSWVAETAAPFDDGLSIDLFHQLHETTQGKNRKTLIYSVKLPQEDLSIVECVDGSNEKLFGRDLLHPLGILVAAREAVRSTVPKRVSKKW